jgi:hypothetical protein
MTNDSDQGDYLPALLDKMWGDYIGLNPQAQQIYDRFITQGERVVNDHIALRTFGLPPVSIDVLARPFVTSGYRPAERYRFPEKKLVARHYEPPEPSLPKVFISQLEVHELPTEAQAVIERLVEAVTPAHTERFDFCCSGRPWPLSFADYTRLREVSDYAAWLAAIGYRPNHFTVLVNELERFKTVEAVNAMLEQSGFQLNEAGGTIKGSPEVLLEQSSVLANTIDVAFSDGAHSIPGCYYEFARRYPRPDGSLYSGFIAASADKIFESTDRGQ